MNREKLILDVGFKTDLSGLQKAKSELQRIQDSTIINVGMDVDPLNLQKAEDALQKAKEAARELNNILDASYSKDLGRINLTSFQEQLGKSNKSLNQMYAEMSAIGPVGEKAFRNIATEVLTVNTQATKTATILDKMADTMKKTIGWGISSSIMKNFSTSVQQAYGYVKNLDSSLNNIRIVSGQSADEMDKFAQHANKAAQQLGAATKEYTDASLIYFQQGLSTEEATARTDITLKMANVLGDSAKEVSSYMTAIWNNFDDGSTSLEHFGDVITNLGANTASSAQEIAEGLEKFASVADTVGLSYDYATSALATVVAQTRQSAEIVGTAFKTLFARIQDLELGETLDDGTTLGKYSQALEAVGVNIKDSSGNMKDMNKILDEMGEKWKTLSKDEQTALAQTVAGTRQYTQLVALMESYDKFKANVSIAEGSDGTLAKQQEIYMDSAEASLQRLKTAWEGVYDSMLDADTIKSVANALTAVVSQLENFIDAIGGGKGAMLLLGSIATKVFSKQIGNAIGGMIGNLARFKEASRESQAQLEMFTNFKNIDAQSEAYKEIIGLVEKRIEVEDILDAKSQAKINNLIKERAGLIDIEEENKKLIEQKEQLENIANNGKEFKSAAEVRNTGSQYTKEMQDEIGLGKIETLSELSQKAYGSGGLMELEELDRAAGLAEAVLAKLNSFNFDNSKIKEGFKNDTEAANIYKNKLEGLKKALQEVTETSKDPHERINNLDKLGDSLRDVQDGAAKGIASIEEMIANAVKGLNKVKSEDQEKILALKQDNEKEIDSTIKQANLDKTVQGVSQLTSGITSLSMAITSAGRISDIWSDDDLSFFEKLTQTLMAATMAIGGFTKGLQSISTGVASLKASFYKVDIMSLIGDNPFKNNTDNKEKIKKQVQKELKIKKEELKIKKEELEKAEKAFSDANIEKNIKNSELGAAKGSHTRSKDAAKKEYWNEEVKKREITLREANEKAIIAENDAKAAQMEFDKANAAVTNLENKNIKEQAILKDILQKEELKELATKELTETASASLLLVEETEILNDEEKIILQKAIVSGNYKELKSELALKAVKEGLIPLEALEGTAIEGNIRKKLWAEAINKKLSKSITGLKDNVTKFAKGEFGAIGTAGAFAAALLAVNWAINQTLGAFKDLRDAQIESNKATITACEEREEEIQKNKESASTYVELVKQYENGQITQLEFSQQKSDLISQIGNEISVLDNLILKYGDADKALKAYNKTQAEASKSNAEEKLNAIKENIDLSQQGDGKTHLIKNFTDSLSMGFENGVEQLLEGDFLGAAKSTALTGIETTGVMTALEFLGLGGFTETIRDKDLTLEQKIANDTKRIKGGRAAANSYSTREILNMTAAQRKGLGIEDDTYSQLKEAATAQDNAAIEVMMRNIMDEEGSSEVKYKKIKEEIQKGIDNQELINDDIEEMIKSAFSNSDVVDSELIDAFDKETLYNSLITNGLSTLGQRSVTNESQTLNYAMGFKGDKQAQKDFQSIYDALYQTEEGQMLLKSGLVDWEKAWDALRQGKLPAYIEGLWKEYQEQLQFNFQKNKGAETLDQLQTLSGMGGKNASEIIESDAFQGLTTIKDEFTTLYKDAGKDYELATSVALAGTEQQIDAAKRLARVQRDNYTESLKESIKKAANDTAKKKAENEYATQLKKNIEAEKEGIKETSDRLNEIKSSYQTLKNVVKDYNKDGVITLDTLESIMEMDSQYLGMLEMQNGQLKINKDSYEEITKAKLKEYQVEATQLFIEEVKDLAIKQSTASTYEYAGAVATATSALQGSGAAAIESAAKFHEFATSVLSDANILNTVDTNSAEYKAIEQAYRNRLAMASSVTSNLDDAMGASTTSKKDYKVDKYEKIDRIINKITKSLEKLEKQETKLVGASLIKNLNEQTDALEAQNKAYEKKLELQQSEAQKMRDKLSGAGATFDDYGNINYNEFLHSITSAYNAGSMTDEVYDKYKEWADDYKDLWETQIQETQDSIEESASKAGEIRLKKLNVKVNMQLETSEADRNFNEWYNKVANKFDLVDAGTQNVLAGKLALKNLTTYETDINALSDSIKSLWGSYQSAIDGDESVDQASLVSDLKDKLSKLQSSMTSFLTEYKNAQDAYLSSIDNWDSKLQQVYSDYQKIQDEANHALAVTKLLFGDDSYGVQNNYLSQTIDSQKQQLEIAKEQVKNYQKLMAEALAEGDTEAYEKYKASYNTWISNMNSVLEGTLTNIKTKYSNSLNQIFSDFEQRMLGQTEKQASDEWDRLKKNASLYLDKVNQAYQISKLQSKYTKQINSSSNLEIQKKITAAMNAQVKLMKDKVKLSQYDVDLANAKYETLMAEIALEESKNNKSTMELVRDSYGNYTYNYVEDASAKQDAEDKKNDAIAFQWNIIKNQYDSVLDNNKSLYSEFKSKLTGAFQIGDEDVRKEQVDKIIKQYKAQFTALGDNLETVKDDMIAFIAEQEGIPQANVTDELVQQYYPNWGTDFESMIEKLGKENEYESAANEIAKEASYYAKTYQKEIDDTLKVVGTDTDAIKKGIYSSGEKTVLTSIAEEDKKAADTAKAQLEQSKTQWEQAKVYYDKYKEQFDSAIDMASSMQDLLDELNDNTQDYQDIIENGFNNLLSKLNDVEVALENIYANDSSGSGAISLDSTSSNKYDDDDEEDMRKAGKAGDWSYINTHNKIEYSKPSTSTSIYDNEAYNNYSEQQASKYRTTQELYKLIDNGISLKDLRDKYKKYYFFDYGLSGDGGKIRFVREREKDNYGYVRYDKSGKVKYNSLQNYTFLGLQDALSGTLTQQDWDKIRVLSEGKSLSGFDTGGYTGEWGDSGKLAMLHEKELVLNKEDTSNILNIVNLVRDMVGNIKIPSINDMGSYMNMSPISNDNSDNSTQNITINAEIQSTNGVDEIKEAIMSLPNLATQYLGRR